MGGFSFTHASRSSYIATRRNYSIFRRGHVVSRWQSGDGSDGLGFAYLPTLLTGAALPSSAQPNLHAWPPRWRRAGLLSTEQGVAAGHNEEEPAAVGRGELRSRSSCRGDRGFRGE